MVELGCPRVSEPPADMVPPTEILRLTAQPSSIPRITSLNVSIMKRCWCGSTIIFLLISTSCGAPLHSTSAVPVLPSLGEKCHATNICAGDLVCSNTEEGAICIPPAKNDKCSAHWECVGMHMKCRDGICRSAQPGDMCGGGGLNCNPDMSCNEHICTVNYAGAACTEDLQCTGSLVCSFGTCSKKPMSLAAKILLFLSIIGLGAMFAAVYDNIEDDYTTVKELESEEATQEEEDAAKEELNKPIVNQEVAPAPEPTSLNSPKWPFRIGSNAEDGTPNGYRDHNNDKPKIISRIFQRGSSYQSTEAQQNEPPQEFW